MPMCAGLLSNASWTTSAYGEAPPARAILPSVSMAIGVCSVLLLTRRRPKAVAGLPLVQVVCKLRRGKQMCLDVISNRVLA